MAYPFAYFAMFQKPIRPSKKKTLLIFPPPRGVLDLWTMLGPFLNGSIFLKTCKKYNIQIGLGQSCNLCSHNVEGCKYALKNHCIIYPSKIIRWTQNTTVTYLDRKLGFFANKRKSTIHSGMVLVQRSRTLNPLKTCKKCLKNKLNHKILRK